MAQQPEVPRRRWIVRSLLQVSVVALIFAAPFLSHFAPVHALARHQTLLWATAILAWLACLVVPTALALRSRSVPPWPLVIVWALLLGWWLIGLTAGADLWHPPLWLYLCPLPLIAVFTVWGALLARDGYPPGRDWSSYRGEP